MKNYIIYVTPELAKKAIDCGFPFEVCEIVDTKDKNGIKMTMENDYFIRRLPTAEQICGWLRSEKSIWIEIYADVNNYDEKWKTVYYNQVSFGENGYIVANMGYSKQFEKYEDAMIDGIVKGLDLIKVKKNKK